ncbi:hypothetical protein M569_03928, partial [Genlisea aurea]
MMMMNGGMVSWRHRPFSTSFFFTPSPKVFKPKFCAIAFAISSLDESSTTARERRQMRNDRRESKPPYNWKEEVETRLMKKTKQFRRFSPSEEMNLDNLAALGPRWWIVRVSRVSAQDTVERMARSLSRSFPQIDFKVYFPSVQIKKKLKNGSISVKSKPLFPGCAFLWCVLNKELHEFIRDCDRVGGFVGSKVGNAKRQMNKPKPLSSDEIEAIFEQAKEEQERADQAAESQQELMKVDDVSIINKDPKPKNQKLVLKLGSSVRVLSGSFAGFTGTIKKLDKKAGLASVGFSLFGKETLADIDTREICHE